VPVLFYGEEIGMGENADIEGRLAVRTPMQWASDDKGGFSSAAASRFPAPIPADGCAMSRSDAPGWSALSVGSSSFANSLASSRDSRSGSAEMSATASRQNEQVARWRS